MADKEVLLERHDGWAEIVINRPERRNSITAPVSEAILGYLTEAESDDSISALIIRGEGGYFCSGIDLKALQADPPPLWKDRQGSSWKDLHVALFGFTKPVIGALESYGINAGAGLAFACDLLIAGESAFLQIGEIQQGVGMPMNAAWLRIKSTEQTMARLAFYGDRVSATDLLSLGLITETVNDDEVLARCREICTRIAAFPGGASTRVKRTIIESRRIDSAGDFFSFDVQSTLDQASMLK